VPTQTLLAPTGISVLGAYGASVSVEYAEIVREFAVGYDKSELVGPTDGQLFLKLNYEFLPDEAPYTVVDVENGSAVTTWPVYLWRFYKRRKADGAAFNVTFYNPEDGADDTRTFKFEDSQLSYDFLMFKLYSTGLLLREYIALI
jgi:hypothetical protein